MAIKVEFCVSIADESCVSELDVEINFDTLYQALLLEFPLYGAIIIEIPGEPEVRIEDELWAAIQGLCFQSIPYLSAYKEFRYSYLSSSGYFVLAPSQASIDISGDYVPSISVPYEETLPALFNCGQRFIKLLYRLKKEAVHYEALIKHLEEQAEIAKQSLEAK